MEIQWKNHKYVLSSNKIGVVKYDHKSQFTEYCHNTAP